MWRRCCFDDDNSNELVAAEVVVVGPPPAYGLLQLILVIVKVVNNDFIPTKYCSLKRNKYFANNEYRILKLRFIEQETNPRCQHRLPGTVL